MLKKNLTLHHSWCDMNPKPRYLQEYFTIDPENDFGYLVLIEIIGNTPTGRSFIVKIPKTFSYYEESHFYYSKSPN
jgi:hypothetical protein